MYSFGPKSLSNLEQVSPEMREILGLAIQIMDFSVVSGYREQIEQDNLFREGLSQVQWPDSKHNKWPSEAVDIAPYPIDWDDHKRFAHLAGIIKGIAKAKGYNVRWGGDWDNDGEMKDNNFNDLLHFELIS